MTGKNRMFRAAAAAVLAACGGMTVGCAGPGLQESFQQVNNNNSWPERNSYLARQAVLHPFEVQQNNAAVLDDVVLNGFFDNGSATLNGVGREKLDRLNRRMPAVHPTVYLQTSNDVAFDDKAPEKSAAARIELDQKRANAVLAYLNARPSRGVSWSVQAIDIADPSVNSVGPASAVRGLQSQYRSGITGGISGGNPAGAGGGLASSTVGIAPNQAGPQQQSGGGTGGTGTGGTR
jgi:hypothetical protein